MRHPSADMPLYIPTLFYNAINALYQFTIPSPLLHIPFSAVHFLCTLAFDRACPRMKISLFPSLSLFCPLDPSSSPVFFCSRHQVCVRTCIYAMCICMQVTVYICVRDVSCNRITGRCTLIRNSQRRPAFTSDITAEPLLLSLSLFLLFPLSLCFRSRLPCSRTEVSMRRRETLGRIFRRKWTNPCVADNYAER